MAFDPDKYLAKKGPAFDPDAYLAKTAPPAAPAQPRVVAPEAEIPPRRLPAIGDIGDRATGFRAQVAETGMTPEERQAAVRGFAGFTGSLLAGPILGGITRGIATAIPATQRFLAPIATSLETGGFRTGLPATTSAVTRRGVQMLGGAGAAGGGALVVEPEAAPEAAAFGAAATQVLPPVAKVLAKGGGAVVDALSGRTPDIRANELIRTAANNEVNALKQAIASQQIPMRDAQPDVPVSRLIADMDLPLLQALLARAEQRDPKQVINAFRQRESQDVVNELTRIAGGPTAETARAARESAKASLTGVTTPMREEAFAAARKTGEVMPKLQTIADDARAEVKDAVDKVRRFIPAIDRAEEWAKSWVASGGARAASAGAAPRPPVRYTFPGQLMGVAERRAGEAAEESLRAGGRARAAENVLESMKARGIEPISAPKLTGSLN
jgi:mannose/fructose-specific phosphotransferase system component IIA